MRLAFLAVTTLTLQLISATPFEERFAQSASVFDRGAFLDLAKAIRSGFAIKNNVVAQPSFDLFREAVTQSSSFASASESIAATSSLAKYTASSSNLLNEVTSSIQKQTESSVQEQVSQGNSTFPASISQQQQPVHLTSEEERINNNRANTMMVEVLDMMDNFHSSARTIGACSKENIVKCEHFKNTDGNICTHPVSGVACNTRVALVCGTEASRTCTDFTNSNGVFCSNGGCAQFIES